MTKFRGPAIIVDAGGTNMKIGFQAQPGQPVVNTIVVTNDLFRQPKEAFDADAQRLLGVAVTNNGGVRVMTQGEGDSFEGANPNAQRNFAALIQTFKTLFEAEGASSAPIFIATNNKEIFLPEGAAPDANHVFSIYGRIREADLKAALHSQTGSDVVVVRDEAALRGGMFPTAAREGFRAPFYVTFGTYMGGGMDTKRGAGLLEVDGDSAPVLSLLQKSEVPWLLPARSIPTSYLARVAGQGPWPSEFVSAFEGMESALDYNWQNFAKPALPSLLRSSLGSEMLYAGHLSSEGHVTMTVEEVAERAASGDAHALAAFEDFGVAAGHILGHAAKLKEADGIVLAGGIAQAEAHFLPALKSSMSEIVEMPIAVVEGPRWAVLTGTAETGRQQLRLSAESLGKAEGAALEQ